MDKNREERLLAIGITSEQIKITKETRPVHIPNLDFQKFEKVDSKNQELICVDKIKSLSNRIDKELSWYDNFVGNNNYRQGPTGSFEKLLQSLEKKGFEEFSSSFLEEQLEPITATYYEDYDCYVIGEGKHRATFAKVIGLNSIKAQVYTVKSNKEEIEKYDKYQNKISKLKEKINEVGLEYKVSEKNTFKREKDITLLYNGNDTIHLTIFNDYYYDNGEIDRNLTLINEVNQFLTKLDKIPFLFFKKKYIDLKLNNSNSDPLLKLFVKRIIKYLK
ncbi:hypothetical protein [Lysinibacillus xylanilyticus]|uniref:ParB/Sulfiredoxin domain-containing protein n=1 Tax=Lysinibacillus xylanilyticus TaxID=582475 RepID=A0ABV3VS29_9BACI